MAEKDRNTQKFIHLRGINQNNLKGIDVSVPMNKMTVVCGPSGSGKSSLAFETLFAEGQRRYIESLSNYAKQFIAKAPKPLVDEIENIPPSIAIEQKNSVKSGRSTVGTTTEVVDYLRLFFEKLGNSYCPTHSVMAEKESVSEATKKVLAFFENKRGYILAPIFDDTRIAHGKKLHSLLLSEGFLRVYFPPKLKKKKVKKETQGRRLKKIKIDHGQTPIIEVEMGEVVDLMDPSLRKKGLPKSSFYLVIDRVAFSTEDSKRLLDSIGSAYEATVKFNSNTPGGMAHVLSTDGQLLKMSEETTCPICSYVPPKITASLFSFNSPIGACSTCKGFGNSLELDEHKVIPNPGLTIAQGALVPFAMPSAKKDFRELKNYCHSAKIDIHTPWADLPKKHKTSIWEGTPEFYGVKGLFDYLETKKYKMHVRVFIARFRSPFPCPDCHGGRLRKESHHVFVHEYNFSELTAMTIGDLLKLLTKKIKLSPDEKKRAGEVFQQIQNRLQFLVNVGVDYLSLDRETRTLSGGEYQRLNLANQLGMKLSQTLYVLDEPTVGLHPRDTHRLIKILKTLEELGNTLVVVEHDNDVIKSSEHLIEMGPGSGLYGGTITYDGPTHSFLKNSNSITAQYLQPSKSRNQLKTPRPVDIEAYKFKLKISGCSGNNLKNVDLALPLNRFIAVTGVSGSGKSSLITHTLYPAVAAALNVEHKKGLPYDTLSGTDQLKNVVLIDQSPIGKTARSNPVTFIKVFDQIRSVMSSSYEAKKRGYSPGMFSLNVDGGRCPVCKGLGYEEVDMVFMDNIEIPCESCQGKKFRPEILDVKFHGKNIYEILNLTVQEAMDFFVAYPNIRRPLSILKEVGLEYLLLGQSASTLSGGESQRMKLAKEFSGTKQRQTLYILDEPTTGLHFREVELLNSVLNKLISAGASVIVIEHNQDVLKAADYVIDIGPEAGVKGGQVVFSGTPKELMESPKNLTGQYFKNYIHNTEIN